MYVSKRVSGNGAYYRLHGGITRGKNDPNEFLPGKFELTRVPNWKTFAAMGVPTEETKPHVQEYLGDFKNG